MKVIKMKNSFLFMLLLMVNFLFIAGCQRCPAETRISPDLSFNTSAVGIEDVLDPNRLDFVDVANNSFSFIAIDSFSGFEKIVQTDSRFECENGNKSNGIYFAQMKSKKYQSDDGNTISISLRSWNPELVLNYTEILPESFNGIDILEVELVFNGCDTLRAGRFVQLNNGDSNVFENDIPFIRSGHRHYNMFSVGVLAFEGGLKFSHSNGIVAFNHCGLELVQLGE